MHVTRKIKLLIIVHPCILCSTAVVFGDGGDGMCIHGLLCIYKGYFTPDIPIQILEGRSGSRNNNSHNGYMHFAVE